MMTMMAPSSTEDTVMDRPFAVIPEAIETAAEWEAKCKPKATEH